MRVKRNRTRERRAALDRRPRVVRSAPSLPITGSGAGSAPLSIAALARSRVAGRVLRRDETAEVLEMVTVLHRRGSRAGGAGHVLRGDAPADV